ncbi:transcription regulator [Salvia divinorum]|uniref:Transcription regulator n=1 Tax=Salvia divinorum TaxID=28513 RepID=A0ABD1GZX2_SALDI
MVKFSSKLSGQIRFLLQNLNDSNSDSVFQELCKCTMDGMEGSILLLQACFDHLNIYSSELKDIKLQPMFASIFKHFLNKPNFSSVLNHDTRMCGKNFCLSQITELCANPVAFESTEIIQHILVLLSRSEGLSKHLDSFLQMLSLVQLKTEAQFVITPFLHDELHGDNFFRLNEGGEDDFDAILAEMEKEISIADVMCELGYGCTANLAQCKEMLSLFLPLTDATVAKILGTIARTYAGLDDSQNVFATFRSALGGNGALDMPPLNSWNVDVLVDSIKQLALGINWINVMENLDHEGFYIPNEAAFSFFMSVYKHACQEPFPLHTICGSIWKNVEGQLSFLKNAVSAPPEVFTFAHSERQLFYDDGVLGDTLQSGPNHAWSCHDLLLVLCQLSEMGHASFVRSVIESPLNNFPEALLLGMAHVNTAYNLIQNEVASAVLPKALKSASTSGLLYTLWHVNQNMLLRGLIDTVNLDPDSVSRILDACQEIKALSQVLDMFPFYFGIRLAVLASKKEIMDLESWLSTQLVSSKDAFYEECIKFLKDVQIGDQDLSPSHFQPSGSLLNIYLEACPTVLKVLQCHAGVLSANNLYKQIEKLDVSHMRANSRMKSAGGSDVAADIETEANSCFHQMFSGHLSIDAMIQMLTRFKESPDKREQSIYECMIANLFEEYKFFSKYPERQLRIAAVLFGSLIKHQLVTHLTLGIALRAVLDALRKPADSKMFSFGTKALEQFVDRLIEWPQYCNHILQISHLRVAHSDLVAFIERALNRISAAHSEPDVGHSANTDHHHGLIQSSAPNMEIPGLPFSLIEPGSTMSGLPVPSSIPLPQRPPSSLDERKPSENLSNYMKPAQSSSVQPVIAHLNDTPTLPKSHSGAVLSIQPASSGFPWSSRSSSAGFGSALNIKTLVAAAERKETPLEAPASEAQDKISFIINNLSTSNVEAKAKEFSEILNSQYYPWFAQYMVMKRASIETNFQDLYLKFLDKVNLKPLNREIVRATYENCKVLLGSELIKSSVEERTLLKNLGSWLGKITIGKNQVLRAREIDPKALIIEAYEKGLMIAVIPFTSKILKPCSNSIAYGPPNPWTMGVLGLLAEIYAMPNLKMNLKFEIQVLFKHLSVDLKDVIPTSLLKDIVREVEGNPDFSNKDVGSSQPPRMNEVKSGVISTLNQVEIPLDVAASPHLDSHSRIMPKLPSAPGLLQGQSQYAVNQVPVPATNIEHQVVVNKKLQAYGLHLHFQSVLPVAMDRAVKEIVSSIVQRNVSIATETTKELVLKDYAMEPDETLIRNAAHLMVARLAGSLAHVTCKESLRGSILNQLRSSLQGLAIASELLEHAFQLVTNDNLDLGCVLIEQAATEKAVQTIDGEIDQQLSIRRKRRDSVGATFFYASLYAQGQTSILPEALRPKPGHLSHSQQQVYEDFARFPGQNRSTHSSNAVPVGSSASSGGGLSRQFASTSCQMSGSIYSSGLVSTGIGAMPQTLENCSDEIEPVGSQIPRSVPSSHISIGDGPQTPENGITPSFPPALATDLLLMEPSSSAKEPGNAAHPNATLSSEHPGTNVSEPLITTGDALDNYQTISEKLENQLANEAKEVEIQHAARPESPESLQQLTEIAKNPANAGNLSPLAVGKEEIAQNPRDKKLVEPGLPGTSREKFSVTELVDFDAAGFSEQVSGLFAEWYQICELPGANDVVCARHVSVLQQRGLLKGDEMTDRFFCRIMELSVSHCLSSEVINSSSSPSTQEEPLSFLAIDIYAKLVFSVLKFFPVDQGLSKLSLMAKVLAVTVKFILKDAEERKASFNPRPYFRLFVNWLLDLCSLDPVFEGANFQVLTALANSFHAIQPLKVPGFSFAWLELVSHRSFMPKLLTANAQKGWPYFQRLLVDLFQFMEPFLRKAELGEPVQFLYTGTLRVLLVLLHDFPEFLCDYHFSFCDVIPPSCIQMRNIILSAFPRNMRLPDPSIPNLKIDLLAEVNHTPRILSEVDATLKAKQIKNDVDEYLKTTQQGSPFLTELKQKLLLCTSDAAFAGTRYNAPLVNSLVLYVGMQSIQQLQARKPPHTQTMANMSAFLASAALDVFQTLIMDLDTEGRYLFLNAVANQLRYPNNHTHYFSFILLHLFAESNQELIQEQITRVLLERLIVNRPHPWGLLITFIELIKNPRYNFWSRSFTRCAPEIEKWFESVSRSCGCSKPVDDSVVLDNLH